jgi:hypothetical protein
MIDGPKAPGGAHAHEHANPQRLPEPGPARPSFRALAGARTPLDAAEASAHLANAWQARFGERIPTRALELLWAQWALETARGSAMRGNNFGGVRANQGGAVYPTTEGFGPSARRVLGRFRTYATPEAGATGQVDLVARRYPHALEALRRGDAEDFVRELARGGYFTADPSAYLRGVERHAAEHAACVRDGPSALSRSIGPELVRSLVLDVVQSLGRRRVT